MNPVKEPRRIAAMFAAIAPRYDLLNHLLSCGLDRYWRAVTVADLVSARPRRVLDVCAGTGDLAFALRHKSSHPEEELVLVDFALPMLRRARQKMGGGRAAWVVAADALRLPFRRDCFDAAMSAFGVRNFVDLEAGLRETLRTLRRHGQLSVLEFCGWSDRSLPRPLGLFIRTVVPLVGRLVSGHESAYSYLQRSIAGFASRRELADLFRHVGFASVRVRELSFGVCTLVVGRKERPW